MATKPATAIGEWQNEVTLEAITETSAGANGVTQTPTPLDPPTWPCRITYPSARVLERDVAATVRSMDQPILSGPFHPGITTKTRLTWTDAAGRTHTAHVTGVSNPDGCGIETVVACAEVVS